jgi:hypothetical protein
LTWKKQLSKLSWTWHTTHGLGIKTYYTVLNITNNSRKWADSNIAQNPRTGPSFATDAVLLIERMLPWIVKWFKGYLKS